MIICAIEGSHEKIRKRVGYLKNRDRYRANNMKRYAENKTEWNKQMTKYNFS